jgi:hypothetical protein
VDMVATIEKKNIKNKKHREKIIMKKTMKK